LLSRFKQDIEPELEAFTSGLLNDKEETRLRAEQIYKMITHEYGCLFDQLNNDRTQLLRLFNVKNK